MWKLLFLITTLNGDSVYTETVARNIPSLTDCIVKTSEVSVKIGDKNLPEDVKIVLRCERENQL